MMGFLNRFLILLLAIATIVMMLAVLGAYTGLIPSAIWQNELDYMLGRYETAAVTVMLMIIALRLVVVAFSRTKNDNESYKGEYVISKNANGEVNIALPTINALVTKVAVETLGVREAVSKVKLTKNTDDTDMVIALSLVVGKEVNVASLTAKVTNDLQRQLKETLSLDSVPVNITISGITDKPANREKRVH